MWYSQLSLQSCDSAKGDDEKTLVSLIGRETAPLSAHAHMFDSDPDSQSEGTVQHAYSTRTSVQHTYNTRTTRVLNTWTKVGVR